ncbi:bifunctional adenosylcobinamide kinase/adenosylcobinamide-phosphate guanylyltransferase [Aneurinibacillus sp. REN35]|uniref:bifunctional adenosylcobinamide kinase/adenosylcobinamide-phosphate guanylyltransferase n=1 Tax=Aneurinibacillus sp. REN35 TaxID=3237286 RepID=UPI0035279B2D
MSIVLITGGVRSGKSAFAEQLAKERSASVLYVATGVCTDEEMEARIVLHRKRRPASWGISETPYDAADGVAAYHAYDAVLFDCVSTWISNLLIAVPEERLRNEKETKRINEEVERWLALAKQYEGTLIVVTSETGLGGVAMSRLGRWFQDVLGSVNQRIAAEADDVYAVLSGIPWQIKGAGI